MSLYCDTCERPIPDEEVRELSADGQYYFGTTTWIPNDQPPKVDLPEGAHKLQAIENNVEPKSGWTRFRKTVYFHFPTKEDLDN
jgi:hypothetical protein